VDAYWIAANAAAVAVAQRTTKSQVKNPMILSLKKFIEERGTLLIKEYWFQVFCMQLYIKETIQNLNYSN